MLSSNNMWLMKIKWKREELFVWSVTMCLLGEMLINLIFYFEKAVEIKCVHLASCFKDTTWLLRLKVHVMIVNTFSCLEPPEWHIHGTLISFDHYSKQGLNNGCMLFSYVTKLVLKNTVIILSVKVKKSSPKSLSADCLWSVSRQPSVYQQFGNSVNKEYNKSSYILNCLW